MSQKSETFEKEPKYGAVILMDSLGTKGIWKNRDPQEVIDRWNDLTSAIENDFESYKEKFRVIPSIHTISDTMIITILGDDVNAILYVSGNISASAVQAGIISSIYLRGCISIGKIFQYDNMILGPAIDEASKYYEKSKWIGVFVTSSAYSALERLSVQSEKKSILQYIEYGVPTENGIFNTWAVRLTNELPNTIKKITKKETLVEIIHQKMEDGDDSEGLEKWKNTLDFMHYIQKKNESRS